MTLQSYARLAVKAFKQFQNGEGCGDEQAEKIAQKIDETFERAWAYLWQLFYSPIVGDVGCTLKREVWFSTESHACGSGKDLPPSQ